VIVAAADEVRAAHLRLLAELRHQAPEAHLFGLECGARRVVHAGERARREPVGAGLAHAHHHDAEAHALAQRLGEPREHGVEIERGAERADVLEQELEPLRAPAALLHLAEVELAEALLRALQLGHLGTQ
jgi:hypothetical protein